MGWNFERFQVGVAAAAPAAGATVTLFDSTVTFNKMGLAANGITRIQFDFAGINQASDTNGFVGYKSTDKGVTWKQCAFTAVGTANAIPCTVAADTGTDSSAYDIPIHTVPDVKFTWKASGTGPTVWPPVVTLQVGNVHSAT